MIEDARYANFIVMPLCFNQKKSHAVDYADEDIEVQQAITDSLITTRYCVLYCVIKIDFKAIYLL